jgi:rhodanese-related sulfurtransferase
MFGWLRQLFRPAAPTWLDPAELRRRLASEAPPLVVDVRNPDEFAGPLGHIETARNIPLGDLPAYRRELAACGRPVVFVCLTDKRSAKAAADLAMAGMRDLAVLRGGMTAWRALDAGAAPA